MASRTMYQIVGRYMDGKEVTGYHLQSIETGKAGKYTKEQVIYLVGRDQITNCTGQIYQDKVILRGNGMSLDDLPVQFESGKIKNTEQQGKIRRNEQIGQTMEKLMIIGSIKKGKFTVGYVIKNAGGATKEIGREDLLRLAQDGKIGNARVQNYDGKLLLRGINCSLDALPVKQIG